MSRLSELLEAAVEPEAGFRSGDVKQRLHRRRNRRRASLVGGVAALGAVGGVVLLADDADDDGSVTIAAPTNDVDLPSTTSVDPDGGVDGPVMYGTQVLGDGGEAASISGRLVLDRGCLYAQSDVDRYPLLWPSGTRWQSNPPAVVLPDGTVAETGDGIETGGGYSAADELGNAPSVAVTALAERCVQGEYREVAVIQHPVTVIDAIDLFTFTDHWQTTELDGEPILGGPEISAVGVFGGGTGGASGVVEGCVLDSTYPFVVVPGEDRIIVDEERRLTDFSCEPPDLPEDTVSTITDVIFDDPTITLADDQLKLSLDGHVLTFAPVDS